MGEIIGYAHPDAEDVKKTAYANYEEFKQSFDAVIRRTEEDFVFIGYNLKVARDTDILAESGYKDVCEFAEAEYGLDKSQVSRFIAINDRFSESGYSSCLREEYRGYGKAKLFLMLLLPEEINEELSPDYSKADIQKIKQEVDEERKVTDLEVLMEEREPIYDLLENDLQRALYGICHDISELYRKLWQAVGEAGSVEEASHDVMEAVAPSGEGMLSARIPGTGRVMVSFRGAGQAVMLVNVRSGEKQQYKWQDVIEALCILTGAGDTPEANWQDIYHEEFPAVAPVQPGKPSKVITAPKGSGAGGRKPGTDAAGTEGNAGETETMGEAPAAAAGVQSAEDAVPDEIGPERLPRGEGTGKGDTVWKEPEKKEHKPVELPPADAKYSYPVGKSQMRDIKGGQRFLILRTNGPYRVGNTVSLQEHADGEATGEEIRIRITWLIDDHGGLVPGYMAFQFEILPPEEKQLEGQMSMEDMEQEREDEAGGTDGVLR